MPTILNIAAEEIEAGNHWLPPGDSVLIQIKEVNEHLIVPKFKFSEVHWFEFDPLLEGEESLGRVIEEDQATKIAAILVKSYRSKKNVIIHCRLGPSRSGKICSSTAIAEVGITLGFNDGRLIVERPPNPTVAKKIQVALAKISPNLSLF
jgi:protein-tyrosine phosphatase